MAHDMKTARKIYFRFILVFIFFSLMLAVMVSAVNFYTEGLKLSEDIQENAQTLASKKVIDYKNSLTGIENHLEAMRSNALFSQYLSDDSSANRYVASQLLKSFAEANKYYFQVRFLDASGQEQIRVDRASKQEVSFIMSDDKLQNKSSRYYFQELKDYPINAFWYSRLDLNIEEGVIEKPYKPTLRVGTPVYHQGRFAGILIINIAMQDLLTDLLYDRDFDAAVLDQDGYVLSTDLKPSSWSRYIDSDYMLNDFLPGATLSELKRFGNIQQHWFSFPLNVGFSNSEELFIVVTPKESFLEFLGTENLKYTTYLAVLILLVAVPIALLLARYPASLQSKLNDLLQNNLQAMALIDKYVIKADLDDTGCFIKLSSAFMEKTGYQLTDLEHKTYAQLFHTQESPKKIQEIDSQLEKTHPWQGEIYGQTKRGEEFWFNASISPKKKHDEITGFSLIIHDVTNEKLVTKLSQTDALTGLNNRLKLDQELDHELMRAKRYETHFAIILVDIDKFKEVNDEFGHLVGDSVLQGIAKSIKNTVRSVDIVGRWGGEEFLIICPVTDKASAEILATKLCNQIRKQYFEYVGYKTASFGVTDYQVNETLNDMVKRADEALYQAKNLGRNQVVAL